MRRFLVPVVALLSVVIALSGCSDDESASDTDTPATAAEGDSAADDSAATDGTSADPPSADDGFCAFLAPDVEIDPTTEEGQAVMAELLEVTPDELRDQVERLFDVATEIEAVPEDDPAAMTEAMALLFDPEVMAAVEAIEAYGVEECGLEPGTFTGTDEGDGVSGSGGTGDAPTG